MEQDEMDTPQIDCRAPEPTWTRHPLTAPTVMAIVMAIITVGGWMVWADTYVTGRAEAQVRAHEAPPINSVHPSIAETYTTLREHTADMVETQRAIGDRAHAVDRKLDKIEAMMQALVKQGPSGAYTRRVR